MNRCFVIQPFDRGRFDKRYDDVFEPSITEAGLEAYRVDRDPATQIPIEDIKVGISGCEVALADITTDNPNVWFELGYAIARDRDVVMICSDERKSAFPFDVQHRTIIKYSTESPSDFDDLKTKIVRRLRAVVARRERVDGVAQLDSVAKMEGLQQHEVAVLVTIAEEAGALGEGLSPFRIRQGMEKAGFLGVASTLGVHALLKKAMIEEYEDTDYDGSNFRAYRISSKGMSWLQENQDNLPLKRPDPTDDLPF